MVSLPEARELLWDEFAEMSDETVQHLITLIKSICEYVITTDSNSIEK